MEISVGKKIRSVNIFKYTDGQSDGKKIICYFFFAKDYLFFNY